MNDDKENKTKTLYAKEKMREIENLTLTIGRSIKAIRQRHNCTLKDLSQLSQVSVSSISNIERGKSLPDKSTIRKLAHSLGLTLDEFFQIVYRQEEEDLEDILNENNLLKEIMPLSSFGPLLREIRETNGFTREESAQRIGISPSNLYKIEQEGQEPSPRIFRAIIKLMWQVEGARKIDTIPEYDLSSVIDQYLLENRMGFRHLAQNCGLPYAFIGNVWRREPDPDTGQLIVPTIVELMKLATGMNISLEELMERAGYSQAVSQGDFRVDPQVKL